MIDKQLRHVKESVLQPIASQIGERFTPTQITIVAAFVGIGAGLAGWQQMCSVGLLLWVVNRVLDGLDGTVARLTHQQSDFGGYVDIIADNIVYAVIPFCLAFASGSIGVWMALAFMLSSFYVNHASWLMLSSILEKRNRGVTSKRELTTITMPTGLVEGTETIVMYILFFLLPQHLMLLYALMGLFVAATVIQRLLWAKRSLD